MGFDGIVSSHLTRAEARAACKPGQKVVKAGTFANGSFGLFKLPRYDGEGRVILEVGQVLITVWHVVTR